MEIERKFLVQKLPLEAPLGYVEMEQGYISTDPVIRIRRQKTGEEESFVLTIKGGGLVMREEYELALDRAQFEGLRSKCTGRIITKIRYRYALSDGLIAVSYTHLIARVPGNRPIFRIPPPNLRQRRSGLRRGSVFQSYSGFS